MTAFKDFNDMHLSLRLYLVGIALVMPFWFMTIFLLKPEFVSDNDMYVSIIASFCLTFCYYTPGTVTSMFFGMLYFHTGSTKDQMPIFFLSYFNSISILAITTFICYIVGLPFMMCFCVVFASLLVRVVIWTYMYLLKN